MKIKVKVISGKSPEVLQKNLSDFLEQTDIRKVISVTQTSESSMSFVTNAWTILTILYTEEG